jgi:hypothetical protein
MSYGITNSYEWYRNKVTGEIHRWIAAEEGLFSLEECGKDQLEQREELTEEEALALLSEKPESACGHCLSKGASE